jgi:hypothetical protein
MFLRKLSIRGFSNKLDHVPDLKSFLKGAASSDISEPVELEDQTMLPEYLQI